MAIDLEALLAPVSEDDPCGPDLALAEERREIERVITSATKIEYVMSTGKPKPLPDADWDQMIRSIVALLGKTKDIGLAAYLCRAGALGKQFEVVAQGAAAIDALLERYWDQAHPHPDESGLLGRKSSCDALANRGMFLNPLERIPVLAHPKLGVYSGADLNRLRRNGQAENDFGLFQQALKELGDSQLKAAYERLGEIDSALRHAAATFSEKTQGSATLGFAPVHELIAELRKTLAGFFVTPVAPEQSAQAEQADGSAQRLQPEAPRGAIGSRDEVVRALDAVADYYRRQEPSSPILPLLERAKAWVPMPFLAVLEDIAPEGLAAAKVVLSKRAGP